jgi:hypothetical protein
MGSCSSSAAASLPLIQARLTAGDYDLGYVRYVLDTVKSQVLTGKIKKEGGAVFKALTDCYLLPDYQQKLTATVSKKKPSPSASPQRKKLLSELEDAHNSLLFIQTAVIYNDDTRAVAVAEVQAKINHLEKQLASYSTDIMLILNA